MWKPLSSQTSGLRCFLLLLFCPLGQPGAAGHSLGRHHEQLQCPEQPQGSPEPPQPRWASAAPAHCHCLALGLMHTLKWEGFIF